jgi:hypothetical protein
MGTQPQVPPVGQTAAKNPQGGVWKNHYFGHGQGYGLIQVGPNAAPALGYPGAPTHWFTPGICLCTTAR